jgi:hypothetical protein
MNATIRVAVLASLLASGVSHGQDADVHVVVKFEPHRELSPALRQSFREQLAQSLNTALQGVGRVHVFDVDKERREDHLQEWDRAFQLGLAKLERIEWTDRAKTHFIHVSVQGGTLRVQSRQADSRLGWCSPLVRDDRTADREGLVRLAQNQIVVDMGLTGTVARSDGERTAAIRFPGTNLSDARLHEWVRAGDVFALVQVTSPGRSVTVPYAYFIASGLIEGGQISGKIESRFTKPLNGWESGQFRAVKLGAANGPVRLRLVGPNEATPADVTIQLFATGMGSTDAERERGQVRGGRFASVEHYDRIAYAKLSLGERPLAKVPIAILGHEPIVIDVNTDPGGESVAKDNLDARIIKTRLNDLATRVAEENEQLRTFMAARKNRQALAKTTDLLRQLDDELPAVAADAVLLRSRSTAVGPMLDEIDRSVRDLKQLEQTFRKTKVDLEGAINAGATPEAERQRAGLRTLVARADQEVQDADYERAIATFEDVLKQSGDWPEIQTRLEGLKRGWAIKSDAHRDARRFVYEVWSKATGVDHIERHMDRAKQSFAVCKESGDKFTPRRIYAVLIRAASWIDRRNEEMKGAEGDESARQAENLRKLSGQVKTLLGEVENYVK